MRSTEASESRARLAFLLVFLLLAAGIAIAGWFYTRKSAQHYRAAAEHQLSAIADLKVGELVQWRKERLADGSVLFHNAPLTVLVRRFLEKPEDADAEGQLRVWLGKLKVHHNHDEVRLLDPQGVCRLSLPAGLPAVSAPVARHVSAALQSGQVTFQDFYHNERDQQPYLGILVPILDEQDATRPLGVVYLRIDPGIYLYPLIQRWPTPSQTAETLLARREGDDVVFLNELRFETHAALNLRFPLDRVTLPAAQAVLGREGPMEGVDYRGTPVMAALRTIPDSPWALVARMDKEEIAAPLRAQLWRLAITFGALLFGAGAGVGLIWRQQRIRSYRESAQIASGIRRMAAVVRDSNDAITLQDFEGRIVAWNHGAELMYGYGEAEALSMDTGRLTPPGKVAEQRDFIRRLKAGEALVPFETQRVTKDGRILDVWMTATRLVDDAGEPVGLASTERDITALKQAEDKLRGQYDFSESLIETAQAIILVLDTQGRIVRFNSYMADLGGYDLDEVKGKNWFETFVKPEDRHSLKSVLQMAVDGVPTRGNVNPIIARDGRTVLVEWYDKTLMDKDGRTVGVLAIGQDITERERAERRIEHLNRVLRAIRDVDQLITHETDRAALLRRACEILVSTRGYRSAWVALRDDEGVLDGVAESRIGEDFGAVREALERGEWTECSRRALENPDGIALIQDPGVNCIACALAHTYRDTAALAGRLQHGGRDYGVLVVALPAGLAADEEETSLFRELIGDVAYALHAMETAQQRRLEEARFRTYVENAPSGIFITDRSGRYVDVNPAAGDVTGRTQGELLTMSIADLLPPESREAGLASFQRLIGEGRIREEMPFVHKSGEVRQWIVSAVKLSEERFLGFAEDITERKQAVEELRKHREQLEELVEARTTELRRLNWEQQVILDTVPAMIWFKDTQNNVIRVNKAAAAAFGMTPEQLAGKSLAELSPDGADKYYQDDLEVFRTKKPKLGTVESQTLAGGKKGWVRTDKVPYLDAYGDIVGLIVLSVDITARVRAEEDLKRYSAQLEAVNKELEAFSYSVSHDLRAPLRHVQGYVDMLAPEAEGRLSDKGRHYMQTIADASREMGELIDDLLAFSRMGRAEMMETSVDLNALVQDAIRDVEETTRGRHIVWKTPPLPAVQADPTMLRLVLANLLGNAVKFTRPRDPAVIEVGIVNEEVRSQRSEVSDQKALITGHCSPHTFFVRDNGVGFDPQYAHKLFGVFQRLHRADEFAGTGIGLANVRRIISRHGGDTWAEGKLNEGATFYFTLRAAG